MQLPAKKKGLPGRLSQCVVSCAWVTNCVARIAWTRSKVRLWFDAPAMASDTARLIAQRKDAVKSRELHFHLGAMDEEKNLPPLIGKLKIDWLDFPVDDILQQYTTLKEGILRGVFKQKAARAWFWCRAEKAQITVLLPGSCSLSEWSEKVDCMPHSWPKSFNIGRMQMGPVQANTFHLHRKFTRALARNTQLCGNQ